jgi:hypothetical protein
MKEDGQRIDTYPDHLIEFIEERLTRIETYIELLNAAHGENGVIEDHINLGEYLVKSVKRDILGTISDVQKHTGRIIIERATYGQDAIEFNSIAAVEIKPGRMERGKLSPNKEKSDKTPIPVATVVQHPDGRVELWKVDEHLQGKLDVQLKVEKVQS